jgi:hypothetical protein
MGPGKQCNDVACGCICGETVTEQTGSCCVDSNSNDDPWTESESTPTFEDENGNPIPESEYEDYKICMPSLCATVGDCACQCKSLAEAAAELLEIANTYGLYPSSSFWTVCGGLRVNANGCPSNCDLTEEGGTSIGSCGKESCCTAWGNQEGADAYCPDCYSNPSNCSNNPLIDGNTTECLNNVTASLCQSLNGTFHKDTQCVQNPCTNPTFADGICCKGDSCIDAQTKEACDQQCGHWISSITVQDSQCLSKTNCPGNKFTFQCSDL